MRAIALLPQHSEDLLDKSASVVVKKLCEVVVTAAPNVWLRVLDRDERDDVVREDVFVGVGAWRG